MKKNVIAILVSSLMCLTAASNVSARSPQEYDNKTLGDLNLNIEGQDADQKVNLAVIAKDDVEFGETMGIEGSVYSGGEIEFTEGDFGGNWIHGFMIGETSDSEYSWGAIEDEDTSFDYTYTPFKVPDTAGFENQSSGDFDNIKSDTYIDYLGSKNDSLVIDASESSITVVIDEIDGLKSLSVTVLGENKVDVYINDIVVKKGDPKIALITQKEENYNNSGTKYEDIYERGNDGQLTFYIDSDEDAITLDSSKVHADIVSNIGLNIYGYSHIIGDVKCGDDFELTRNSKLWGDVYAPDSDSHIGNTATLYGTIITDTLDISEQGYINYVSWGQKEDEEKPVPTPTEEPAEMPTEEPEADETAPSADGTVEIFEGSSQYAYIFGDEPLFVVDPETNEMTAEVYMQPDRNVSRQEVCAMIMRLVDQYIGVTADESDISENIIAYDDWAAKGLGYLSAKGAYDDIEYTVSGYGYPARGEVAKLVAIGLDLEMKDGAIDFTDIAGNEFEYYIDVMTSNGYMHGDGNGEFRPSDYMTRAEFCSMFNNITGRTEYELFDEDGSTITPATYYIVDLDNADTWKVNAMMLGTSAFTDEYKVDVQTRIENIRNVLDNYDGQKEY